MTKQDSETLMCFEFDKNRFENNTKEFFLGYPVINFFAKQPDGVFKKI